ncbi:MAG: nitrophenyl compound nitroreductase subunit ArsF family protein [Bacteroidales bacterium]|nr:nitrophenyl compound nitroreductase subunit ArsF family protein [Bacteroidales bacterium]
MQKLLILLLLVTGLAACSSKTDGAATQAESPTGDRVEVVYFHGAQRCPTCQAIEKCTREVIDAEFADELKSGKVVFKVVDISTSEGESLADRYEVTWSSLSVNKWKDGNESRNDMTDFAFGNARSNPDEFKAELADAIRKMLE